MKFAAEKLGHPSRNISLDRIDTHLNQAGGECATKMAGFDDKGIGKMGRWLPYLSALLEYTQHQILGLSQSMVNKMSRIARFTNIGGSSNHAGLEFHTVYGGRHYHNSFLHIGGN